jgi:hypothetical protein
LWTREAHAVNEADASEGVQSWQLPTEDEFRDQIRYLEALELGGLFYGQTDSYVRRAIVADQGFHTFHNSIKNLAASYDCDLIIAFSRVSERRAQSEATPNPSLEQQTNFCLKFAPPDMNREKIQLDSVSITSHAMPVAEELYGWENAVILVTSVSRICRTRAGLEQLQEVCRRRNLVVVVMVWPPHLAHAVHDVAHDPDHSWLDESSQEILCGIENVALDSRSYPSLCPTLVIAPDDSSSPYKVHRDAWAALLNEVRASEAYIRGLGCSRWQGSPFIALPPSLKPARWTADRFQKALRAAIKTCFPSLAVSFSHFETAERNTVCGCEQMPRRLSVLLPRVQGNIEGDLPAR